MSEEITFLLTLLNSDDTLLKVCISISKPSEVLTGDCALYPMEKENREQLFNLLPEFCKVGKIVDIESIFTSINK
jgi:hypothetical protein